ncbi:MAG: CBS domain-containing protein [Rhodovulum sp.]|nr:CBS domain-containing protein [Rhodovulum sp.]
MTVGVDRPFRTLRRLAELRQPRPATIAANARLDIAAALMAEQRLDALAVLLDGGTVVGVLTGRGVTGAVARHPETPPRALTVADAMDRLTIQAGPDTTVPEALALLTPDGPDHLVVLDDGRLVDLLSRTDLLAELAWHHAEVIREMRLQERIMHLQGTYSC